jgi:hypothetical protein
MTYQDQSTSPTSPQAWVGLQRVIHRFPLVFFCLLALFVIGEYLYSSNGSTIPNYLEFSYGYRLFGSIALAGLWAIAVHIWAEASAWSQKKLLGLFGVGFTAILLLVFQTPIPSLWESMFLAMGLGILPFIAPFSGTKQDQMLFFSRHTANLSAGIGLGMVFFWLIVLLIYIFSSTSRSLLGVIIPDAVLDRSWLYLGIFFPTLYALSFIPQTVSSGTFSVSRALSFVVTYIAVPALCLFGTLVIVYGLKILFLWQLPQGHLGIITGNIGAFALGVWIVAQCTPKAEAGLLAIYKRFFPYAWIPINILLMVAIGNRVMEHGITEQRLFVMLMAGWFFATNLLLLLAPSRLLLGLRVLAVLLLLGSFGPWSVSNLALENQKSRFVATLTETGLLVNGVVHRAKDPNQIPDEKIWALCDWADFFIDRGRIDFLWSFLPPSSSESVNKKDIAAKSFMTDLGLYYVDRWQRNEKDPGPIFTIYPEDRKALSITIKEYDQLWRYEYISFNEELSLDVRELNFWYNGKKYFLLGNGQKGTLTLTQDGKIIAEFNIKEEIQSLYTTKKIEREDRIFNNWVTKDLLSLEKTSGSLRWSLFFTEVTGHLKKENIESVNQIRDVFFLVGPAP